MTKAKKSLKNVIEDVAKADVKFSKEDIKKYLVQDMRNCIVFMNEIIGMPGSVDALVDVYYQRYVTLMETKNQTPDPEDVPDSLSVVEDPSQTKMFEDVR